jgi:hypothetical protein
MAWDGELIVGKIDHGSKSGATSDLGATARAAASGRLFLPAAPEQEAELPYGLRIGA